MNAETAGASGPRINGRRAPTRAPRQSNPVFETLQHAPATQGEKPAPTHDPPLPSSIGRLRASWREADIVRAQSEVSAGRPFSAAVLPLYAGELILLTTFDAALNALALSSHFESSPRVALTVAGLIVLGTLLVAHWTGRAVRRFANTAQDWIQIALVAVGIVLVLWAFKLLADFRVEYLQTLAEVTHETGIDPLRTGITESQGAAPSDVHGKGDWLVFVLLNTLALVCGIACSLIRHECNADLEAWTLKAEGLRHELEIEERREARRAARRAAEERDAEVRREVRLRRERIP